MQLRLGHDDLGLAGLEGVDLSVGVGTKLICTPSTKAAPVLRASGLCEPW